MRLCRFTHGGTLQLGFYRDTSVVPLAAAAGAFAAATHERLTPPTSDDPLELLPPDGAAAAAVRRLFAWVEQAGERLPPGVALRTADVELHVPFRRPNKLFLLAGNYNEHIQERGGRATERDATFPYVFMKPPSTTLTDPGRPIVIPRISPAAIDWELELAVVIGRRCKAVAERDALSVVAGYTIINDVSNRRFRPNPQREKREKDVFFDWLHGKWHDSFCPCGPCLASADTVADPQDLPMRLTLNGAVKQDASTRQQVFPVAAVIEFISNLVTLEPGDVISTGTPAGVGSSTGTFLRPGDVLAASIGSIGTLTSPVVAEA